MQIEVGKHYMRRDGKYAGIAKVNTDQSAGAYPFKVGQHSYTKNGAYSIGADHHGYDLVAEWQDEPAPASPLVVTRGGKPVEDQAQGIRDFKEACRRAAEPPAGPILLDWSATASPEYAPLAAILQEAYDQAARGKGRDRHDNGEPFTDQRAMSIGRKVGPGFPLGQSLKKTEEAATMISKDQHAAAIRELLGAINYAASAIMLIREQNPGA